MGSVGDSVTGAAQTILGGAAAAPGFVRQGQQYLGRATGFDQFTPNVYRPDLSQFAPNAQEQQFTNELMARMQGQGPSVAELQMQRGLDQSNAQAMAMAAAQRGISPGLAARMAQQAQAQNQQNVVGQQGVLRAQEMLANAGLLGGTLQSQRQSRGLGQQLAVQGSLGSNQLALNSFEGSANRGQSFMKDAMAGATQALTMMNSGGVAGGDQMMSSFANALGQQLGQIMASQPRAAQASDGGFVPGQANVPGDHPVNDTVPAMLSPGEIVVPRTVVQKGPEAATAFVQALMARG